MPQCASSFLCGQFWSEKVVDVAKYQVELRVTLEALQLQLNLCREPEIVMIDKAQEHSKSCTNTSVAGSGMTELLLPDQLDVRPIGGNYFRS